MAVERVRPGDVDLSDPDVFVEHGGAPYAYLEMLREEAPLHWAEPPAARRTRAPIHRGYWVVTRHADCVAVSSQPSVFSSREGGPVWWDLDEDGSSAMRFLLPAMDPPEHTRGRERIESKLLPFLREKLAAGLRDEARRRVAAVRTRGSCDFASELASALPEWSICELAGVPEEERSDFLSRANRLFGADDPRSAAGGSAQEAATELWLSVCELAAAKHDEPDDSLLSRCLEGVRMDGPLTDVELNNLFLVLVASGLEPARHAASQCLRLFLEHPEAREHVCADLERRLPVAIEEVLRFAPPRLAAARTARTNTVLAGQRILQGQKLYLSYPSANRDESVFEQPMEFDVTRTSNEHLGFGAGPHTCLGAELARMQLRALLEEVLTQLPNLSLMAPPRFQRSHLVAGITELPVRW